MTLIYKPKGRAGEYAALACNVYSGCDHGCVYCYAPSVTFKERRDFVISKQRTNFVQQLNLEAKNWTDPKEQVLLCFTCDPYQHLDQKLELTRQAILTLKAHGFPFCVLTKGGSRALRDIDLYGPRDAFATTLTFLDDERSLLWEPQAALPTDRISTIHTFYSKGITTWVSLEPVLDPEASLEIIRQTHTFVDLYKVGRLNYHPLAQTINWYQFAHDAVSLLDSLGKKMYVKKDLAVYLSKTAA